MYAHKAAFNPAIWTHSNPGNLIAVGRSGYDLSLEAASDKHDMSRKLADRFNEWSDDRLPIPSLYLKIEEVKKVLQ